jgi:hypothetical protein
MKLVCFSNNTAGGLVCDLLNHRRSNMDSYKTTGSAHSLFKVGDRPDIQWAVNTASWQQQISLFRGLELWMGTHLHPSGIPDRDEFQQIVVITTESRLSRLYRWLRYYHVWFCHHEPDWAESDDLAAVDRIRELAKNVFEPYTPYPGCWNVEFEHIVSGQFVAEHDLDYEYYQQWRNANAFLYSSADSWAVQRFNEAEWEILNQKPYRYI